PAPAPPARCPARGRGRPRAPPHTATGRAGAAPQTRRTSYEPRGGSVIVPLYTRRAADVLCRLNLSPPPRLTEGLNQPGVPRRAASTPDSSAPPGNVFSRDPERAPAGLILNVVTKRHDRHPLPLGAGFPADDVAFDPNRNRQRRAGNEFSAVIEN